MRAAILVAAVFVLAACGGEDNGSGTLVWSDGPTSVRLKTLPDDRIVGGKVRNESLRVLDLAAKDMRLVDADGRRVHASITFQTAPGHALWPTGRINRLPLSEQYRLGMRAKLKPGDESSFVVAWRLRRGQEAPVRIDYGLGSLALRK